MRAMVAGLLLLPMLATTCSSVAHADGGGAMDRYVAEVIARNPSLRAGALRHSSYGDEAAAVSQWQDPTVAVMLDRVPQSEGGEMPMIRYQVSQMVPFPGKLGLMRDAVERQGDGAAADVDSRRLDLRLAAERAYVMLWMNAKRRELNRSQRALASTIASAALGRYGAGTGEHHDVVRAQVEINALDVEHINLEGERDSTVAMINALRNQPSDVPFAAPLELDATPQLPPLVTLADRAVTNRPELRRMRAMQREAGAMAQLARRERYPDFMTSVWANQMICGAPTMGAMVGVTVPVFGMSRGAHLGAAFDARAQASVDDAEAMRAMIRAEVSEAYVKAQTATRQLALLETIAGPKAHESFDSALAGYGSARLDIVGLLDSRRALQSVQQALIDARALRVLAQADLEHAVGGAP